MASFATFAVGFVVRPLGAALFGHWGDKYGRRRMLLVTVVTIGVVTAVIGLLPTYQTIGVAAPILLVVMRILQGISVGGEWSGAAALAIEHAPIERRGRYAVMPQLGSPVGSVCAAGAFALVGLLPDEQFAAWGWRLPFQAAFGLLLIALWVRLRVDESPVFQRMLREHAGAKLPVIELFRTSGLRLLVGVGVALLGIAGLYLCGTFLINYGSQTAGVDQGTLLDAATSASAINVVLYLLFGRLADRVGAAPLAIGGALISAIVAFPLFCSARAPRPALWWRSSPATSRSRSVTRRVDSYSARCSPARSGTRASGSPTTSRAPSAASPRWWVPRCSPPSATDAGVPELERTWGRRWGAADEVGRLRTVLVRRPNFAALATATEDLWDPVARAYLDPAGRWYWRDPKLPDVEAAADQHAGLVAALRAEDVEVVEAPDLPDELTSSVFTRDPLVTVPGGAIIARLAPRMRRGEEPSIARSPRASISCRSTTTRS